MEIILKQDIPSLGYKNDIINVKDGYGRNYLLPQGKALLANAENLAIVEKNTAAIASRLEKEQKIAEKIAKKISGLDIVIEQLAGEDDRLFGSVTNADICDKLAELNITLDKKQIVLPDPIKTLGETKVPVKVRFQVATEITVTVKPLETKE